MEARRVHLDTWPVIEVVFEGEYVDRVAEIMRRAGLRPYELAASQAALGEAAAVIMRKGPEAARMLRGMLGLLADHRIDPGRCMPPMDARVLAVVQDLVGAAPELDMTDRIIVAHALVDPYSVLLLMKDSVVVGNRAIRACEESARARGLRNAALEIVNPAETFPAF